MADNEPKQTAPGIRVAVYGSLKKGGANAGCLGYAEFLGRDTVRGRYLMLDLQYYPAVVESDALPLMDIPVEVYRITEEELAYLDILEGHPGYYARKKVDTKWKGTWMYFLPEKNLERGLPIVHEGLWQPSDEEKEWFNGRSKAA